MSEFTYRSARSGSQVAGLALAMVVEAALTDGFLHASHPLVAWVVIVVSVVTIAWFAADYRALGRGAVRVDDRGLDLRVGYRTRGFVSRVAVANAVHATWRDIPVAGSRDGGDYRNLMKPASPNVLVTLTGPTPVRWFGITLRPRRIGLRLDDPAAFVSAICSMLAGSPPAAI